MRRVLPLAALAFAAVAAVPLPAAAVAAQPVAPDTGGFVIRVGADTLAVERFRRTADTLAGEAMRRGSRATRVRYAAALAPDGTVPSITVRSWRAAADPDHVSPAQQAAIRFAGDSAHVVGGSGGRAVPTRPGAIPYVNILGAHLDLVTRRARRLARETGRDSVAVPLFLVEGGQTAPAAVRFLGDSATVAIGSTVLRLRVDGDGGLLGGVQPSSRVTIERVAAVPAALFAPMTRDYSAPAGAPYAAEDVTIAAGAGHRLAGTLTLPTNAPRPVPAVLLISGSSPQDRDYATDIGPGEGYALFRWLADTLSRRGIAVLRVDDRGVGQSTGDLEAATTGDRADDARLEVAYLRGRPEIDRDRIALVGISEGGAIAPMLAAADSGIAGIVTLAGPASTGRAIVEYQLRHAVAGDTAILPAARDSALHAQLRAAEREAGRRPWMRGFLAFDPLPYLRRVRVPVLVMHGATDRNVPVADAQALAAAVRSNGNDDVTVHVLPGVNHILVPDPDGNPAGYARLPSLRVPDATLGLIADWLAARLGATVRTPNP